jgi:molybdopterin-guanine dinucleotide biosynthesis protein A/molybdopterin converting factor small subunit
VGVANVQSNDPAPNATAVILTGGKSSRMGQAKALLLFDEEPLIVHIARALKRMFAEIVVVAAPEQELPALPAKVVYDEIAYQGPVGGIYYGLRAAGGEFSFVTSCDAPFLNSALIAYLTAQISNYDVVVPFWEERYQPLHAVYRRSVLPLLKEQLERGELRPVYLFDKVRTRTVEEAEIKALDPDGLTFLNMNTPQDYEAALQRWRQMRQRKEIDATPGATCTVELFGTAQLLAKAKTVSLSLPPEATLARVLSSLAEKLPMLVGRVITLEGTRLASGFACNINGLAFIRDPSAKIASGDRILIVSADAGG